MRRRRPVRHSDWSHLNARFGLVLDNVIEADVVTADGRFLTVNAHENEDLFIKPTKAAQAVS